jgi:hypothetical protein
MPYPPILVLADLDNRVGRGVIDEPIVKRIQFVKQNFWDVSPARIFFHQKKLKLLNALVRFLVVTVIDYGNKTRSPYPPNTA